MALKVREIKNGTVIDHLNCRTGPIVYDILNLRDLSSTVIPLYNIASKKLGKKDMMKIEDKELDVTELNKISLISPDATINIIRGSKVIEKKKVEPLDLYEGIVACCNPSCISNYPKERVVPKILRVKDGYNCFYCERILDEREFPNYFIKNLQSFLEGREKGK